MRRIKLMPLILVAGVFVITMLSMSGKTDPMYILIVLGAVCIAMGIAALIKGTRSKKGLRVSDKQRVVIFIILGVFLVALGMINILGIELSEMGSTGVMGLLLVLIITYFVIRVTRR